jgi:hypothetical protein
MQVSVDRKIYAPLVLCFAVACALAFLLISTTAQAGHDNGDNQCISDVKVIDLGNAKTFAVNGQSPTVGFEDHRTHDTKEDEVILQVDTTPTATVRVPESDIGDGGSDKGNWNSISNTTSLEVRIPGVAGDGGGNITSISVEVHDTECGGGNQCDSSTCSWEDQSCGGGSCDDDQMLEVYNCSDGDCSDGNTQCVSDSSCSSSCNPPNPGDGCRVESVCGGELSWNGTPSSEASDVETQQADSQSSDSPNSASLDVSSVPNDNEEITDITVGYSASASCTLGGYSDEDWRIFRVS